MRFDVDEVAPRLSALIHMARHGEEIVITSDGRPAVRLESLEDPPRVLRECDRCVHDIDVIEEIRNDLAELRRALGDWASGALAERRAT